MIRKNSSAKTAFSAKHAQLSKNNLFTKTVSLIVLVIAALLSLYHQRQAPHHTALNSKETVHVVTLATYGQDEYLRSFIARIHYLQSAGVMNSDVVSIIYYLGNDTRITSELSLWENTVVFEPRKIIKAIVSVENQDIADSEAWRPFCIEHAVNLFRKTLYVDVTLGIAGDLKPVIKRLNNYGAYLVLDSETLQWDARIQGYVYGGDGYKTFLAEQLACIRNPKQCENKQKGNKNKYDSYAALPSEIFVNNEIHPQNFCFIRHSSNLVYLEPSSQSQFQVEDNNGSKNGKRDVVIAMGIPATSKGSSNLNVPESPFLSVFLPSFLQSIRKDDRKFKYVLLLGIDETDPLYDHPKKKQDLMGLFKAKTAEYPVDLEIVTFAYSRGWVVYVWNGLFELAVKRFKANYFYQVNDDTQFINPGWAEEFVNRLETSRIPNIGVTGPLDTNNPRILTCSFVSKLHFDIFGFYYPPVFHNWYSDDWITKVYEQNNFLYRTDIHVHNTNINGTRYIPCGGNTLQGTLQETSAVLQQYIARLVEAS